MKTIKYTVIPAMDQWRSDTSVTFAIRKDDRILSHLDKLIEKVHAKAGDVPLQLAIVADLFFTANTWVRLFHARHRQIKAERYPAVIALFECVVGILCSRLDCKQTELLQQLSAIFGSELTGGGNSVDNVDMQTRYLDRMERNLYRLHFQGGLAYQYPWWALPPAGPLRPGEAPRMPLGRLQLADSIHAYNPALGRMNQTPSVNYGTFVCSLEREFFMTKQYSGQSQGRNGIYHSSYTAGMPVIGGGSMLIKRGVVKAIRDDSGHYQPQAQNMAGVLQALEMFGVSLSKVQLVSWKNAEPLGTAVDFLRSNLSWTKFLERREGQLSHHKLMHPSSSVNPAVANAPIAEPGPYFNVQPGA